MSDPNERSSIASGPANNGAVTRRTTPEQSSSGLDSQSTSNGATAVSADWDRSNKDKNKVASSSSRNKEFWDGWNCWGTFLLCVMCFFVVLGTATLSKLTLLLMVHNLPPLLGRSNFTDNTTSGNTTIIVEGINRQVPVAWVTALLLVICTPHVFSAFSNLYQLCFKRSESDAASRPSAPDSVSGRSNEPESCPTLKLRWKLFTLTIIYAVAEAVHSGLLALLVFAVLPSYDPLLGCILLMNITGIPALLRSVYKLYEICRLRENRKLCEDPERCKQCKNCNPKEQKKEFCKSIFSLLFQVTGLVLLGFHVKHSIVLRTLTEIVLILLPLVWRDTFVQIPKEPCMKCIRGQQNKINVPSNRPKGFDSKKHRKCHFLVSLLNFDFKKHRKCHFLVSLLKIGLPVFAVMIIYRVSGMAVIFDDWVLHSDDDGCNRHLPYILASINISSSVLCYAFATVACKVRVQGSCFALPLMLAPGLTFGLMHLHYFKNITEQFLGCDAAGLPLNLRWEIFPGVAGICSYLAYFLFGLHLFTNADSTRLQSDCLFKGSWYCGVFVDSSLVLTRKDGKEQRSSPDQDAQPKTMDHEDGPGSRNPRDPETLVYVCATMWHEEREEMTELVASIRRLNAAQTTKSTSEQAKDGYKLEAHIFFDDAFEPHGKDEEASSVNDFVTTLIEVVAETDEHVSPPSLTKTPYGGRLTWELPGGNLLVAHLKDKVKIRIKKRWSQVMYMHYLLAYRLADSTMSDTQKLETAQNTFLLALDGDVDFQPEALLLLIDRLKLDPNVGAACSRIHPVGSGPMVWYQKFEYAASHWLFKTAEHVFGCVLCSPGCFSLFRASALMEDNVIKTYRTPSTEARHFVQYDQGEDRWLCTLLLKQGYRVEYCAASDSYTHAPEGFYELFNQRRRWNPSTMANIIDLLGNQEDVRQRNQNISFPYIVYQWMLLVSTLITPGTIFMLIVGAFSAAYKAVTLTGSLVINLVPVAIFVVICFKCKPNTQLLWAQILSVAYILLMMLVLVGMIRKGFDFGICSVTSIFICLLVGVFLLSAILHPREFSCVFHGLAFFLLTPSMTILLAIYSLANLHRVSWGTRETQGQQRQETNEERGPKQLLQGFRSALATIKNSEVTRWICCGIEIHGGQTRTTERTGSIDAVEKGMQFPDEATDADSSCNETDLKTLDLRLTRADKLELVGEDLDDKKELKFWKDFIQKYLTPLKNDVDDQKATEAKLIKLRNGVCVFSFVLNGIVVSALFTLAYIAETAHDMVINLPCNAGFTRGEDIQPISLAFMLVFGVILTFQFVAMLWHRGGTILHIASVTELCKKEREELAEWRRRKKDSGSRRGIEETSCKTIDSNAQSSNSDTNEPSTSYSESDMGSGNIQDPEGEPLLGKKGIAVKRKSYSGDSASDEQLRC